MFFLLSGHGGWGLQGYLRGSGRGSRAYRSGLLLPEPGDNGCRLIPWCLHTAKTPDTLRIQMLLEQVQRF